MLINKSFYLFYLSFKSYETVNIYLKNKPEWYVTLNPAAAVPCLQFADGRTIPESLIVAEYLDAAYPENKLIPT
jgi:glutathione S-transferase